MDWEHFLEILTLYKEARSVSTVNSFLSQIELRKIDMRRNKQIIETHGGAGVAERVSGSVFTGIVARNYK